MIRLQNFTCAFLWCSDCMLLMKHSASRAINPNFWSGVGGKMEGHEINDPYRSCLREVYEETGISSEGIYDFELKYIIIRRHEDVIRQSYVYFGNSKSQTVKSTDEGDLFWIPRNEILGHRFTGTFTEMMKHYLSVGHCKNNVITGVAENAQDGLQMHWTFI